MVHIWFSNGSVGDLMFSGSDLFHLWINWLWHELKLVQLWFRFDSGLVQIWFGVGAASCGVWLFGSATVQR